MIPEVSSLASPALHGWPWSSAPPPQGQVPGRDSSARKMSVTREGSRAGRLEPFLPHTCHLVLIISSERPGWRRGAWWGLESVQFFLLGMLLSHKVLLGHGLVDVYFVSKNWGETLQEAGEEVGPHPPFPSTTMCWCAEWGRLCHMGRRLIQDTLKDASCERVLRMGSTVTHFFGGGGVSMTGFFCVTLALLEFAW